MRIIYFLVIVLVLSSAKNCAFSWEFERRRPQFTKQLGYFLIPAPYSLAGLGSGVAFVGTATNIADTFTDAFGAKLVGDVEGYGVGITDFHLIDETLIIDINREDLSRNALTVYRGRGTDSDKEDAIILERDKVSLNLGRIKLTTFERRLEIYLWGYEDASRPVKIRDNDGHLIEEIDEPNEYVKKNWYLGVNLDLTDDFQDPRNGFRLNYELAKRPRKNQREPDFHVINVNLTAYVPMGKQSTWVFNYFSSDAVMNEEGETDKQVLRDRENIDCSSADDPPACEDSLDALVDSKYAHNKYGTASSLGGFSRLRSYGQVRFKGAHTRFLGTELRWNLSDENTPFNWYFINDIRTVFQLAFFYEQGSVTDDMSTLMENTRDSYGAGLRLVTGSGLVYRVDYATGEEGAELTTIVYYPWE